VNIEGLPIANCRLPDSDRQSAISNRQSGIKRMKSSYSLLLILILMPAGVWSQDAQVTASVNSDTIGLQDQLQLTITVSGKDSSGVETPRFSSLKGFKIVSGPNVGTQFQWINGKTSNSTSFSYVLIPEKEGQYTIDPVDVRVSGRTLKTQPLQVRVTSAARTSTQPQRQPGILNPFDDDNSRSRAPDGDAVFIKAELDRHAVYPGQQVTLFYRLYTRVRISGIQIQENPPLNGFWVEDLEVEKAPKGERQVVNGREYQAFIIKKQALFATTTGKLKIPSSTFAISASAGNDFMGIFSREETLYRKTPETFLEVKPLPAGGRPSDFSNAVGSFKLTADIDKTQVATGEAVALRIKLEGKGNLKMIPDIALPSIPDFTVYSSKRADAIRPSAEDQIGGDKTWEYVLVPKAPGRQIIPSLSFSYFNAAEDKYVTIATSALTLNVTRGADSSTAFSGIPDSVKQDLIRRGNDISFIKQSAGSLENQGRPLVQNPWFYLLAAISLALNAGVFFYQRQRHRLGGSRILQYRKAKRKALKQLRNAEKEGQSDSRRYYDRAAAALSGYLVERFHMMEIELTGDNLARTLSRNSVPLETVEETRACLQECDFGRFVSASDSKDKMLALSARIQKNIDALERNTPVQEFRD
jgi:hypothetical protein